MAGRRSHRDLRLQFADETELRGGSDAPRVSRRATLAGSRRADVHPQRVAGMEIDRVRRNAQRRDPCGETARQPRVAGEKRRRGGECSGGELGSAVQSKRKQEPWPSRSEIESSPSPSPRNGRRGRAPCSRSCGATRRRGTESSGTTATRRATRRPRARCTPRAGQPAQRADEGLRVARSPANDAPSAQHRAESRGVRVCWSWPCGQYSRPESGGPPTPRDATR